MRLLLLFLTLLTATAQQALADNSAKYRYLYIEAARQMDMDHVPQAFELFKQCQAIDPNAPETCFALGRIYAMAKQDSLSFVLLKRATMLAPDNTEFAERLANGYLYNNLIDSATVVYEQLAKTHPERTEYLSLLMRIYEHNHQYDKLLSALNRYETQEGQSEDITLSKMQAYANLGDMQGAYKELKGLVDAHPYDMNLKVMMGNWLLSNGRKKEALQTFLNVLKEEPDNAQGQMSLMDYYRAEGQTAAADSMLYHMLVNPHTDPATRVTLVRDWVQDNEEHGGDSTRVIQMFDRVLELPQTTAEVATMRVAYLMLKEAPKDSIRKGWEEVLRIAPENVEARINLISMMWADSIDENVIRECKKAIEYIPDEPLLYYHLGVAQYINKHNDDAIATLRRGTSVLTKETKPKVAGDIFSVLGDVLQKEGRTNEAYAAYDSCLIHDPDNVLCLNNYAYFLSLDQKDLKKAEKMSYRAITAEANNGTYIDTYAWILYQQQRYEEARIYIEQAIKCEENSAKDSTMAADSTDIAGDILEHAGDIYIKLNRQSDALRMWNRALKAGVDDEATLRKKIKKYQK